jgi:hypothetical protein
MLKMRLLDLAPRWIEYQGRKVGMLLLCPHCQAQGKKQWLSCFFEKFEVLNGGNEPNQYAFFEKTIDPGDDVDEVVPCDKTAKWTRTSDDFATMSVTPSLDASASGHWHGSITNGQAN